MSARMLLVDDDDIARRALATALTRSGYHVTAVDDIVPALALTETFDIVLADFNMKTGTGDEVVRHYKARFGAQVYCAILSGDHDDVVHATCTAAGADAILAKPASLPELRKCLSAAVEMLKTAS
jgi:CheY-like chemotaxis protein